MLSSANSTITLSSVSASLPSPFFRLCLLPFPSVFVQLSSFPSGNKMPRSFLVKQQKVHNFSSSADLQLQQQHWDNPFTSTHAITKPAPNLAVRLSDNGEFNFLQVSFSVCIFLQHSFISLFADAAHTVVFLAKNKK